MSATLAGTRGLRPSRDPRAVARELRVLLRFRLTVGGAHPARRRTVVAALAIGLGLGVPVAVAAWAPRDQADDAVVLTPVVWTVFVVAAVVAALAAAGGRELLPRAQAVAYPVSSTTDQLGALVLTPLNVAWSLQALLVLTTSAYAVGPDARLPFVLLAAWVWLVAATCVAGLLGWVAELVRTLPFGRWLLRGVLVLALLGGVALVWSGLWIRLLDRTPVTALVVAAILGPGDPVVFALVQLGVLLVAAAAVLAAVPLGELLEQRPLPDDTRGDSRLVRRHGPPRSELAAAVLLDVRSVVRSPPLRRGLVVLLLTPLLAAALVELPWVGVVVLPALVGSGTALLYGVNALALDGRGALWRDSLPHRPHTTFVGRLLALTLLCLVSSTAVVAVASVRAETPSAVGVLAVVCAIIVTTAQVVSRCARWSMRKPYPAELRRSRDTPAPPAAMAGYSVRLSVVTTVTCVALGIAVVLDSVIVAVGVSALLLSFSLLRLRRAALRHADTSERARAVATVVGA
ncbi:hypothetical protein [Aquipuribacter sp. SD81]|uniref:hypothetical protein n=1 Tax=Aquipuribacter sp. SD81 TaxID=3127703 RepID=UPI00301A5592